MILDVGCGTAFPVGSFIPQTSIYLGMDISLEMLGHAKILLGDNLNAALWNIDAERIPLPDNCIDLCLGLMAFNVFPNPHKAATEIHRVLKKDGTVYGTVFVQPPPGGDPQREAHRAGARAGDPVRFRSCALGALH